MRNCKRIKSGLYLVHGIYVQREMHMCGTNRRAKFGGARHTYENTWHAYRYYDDSDGTVACAVGKDFDVGLAVYGTLTEAKAALAPRPGKMGTHSTATYQVIGNLYEGGSVIALSDLDERCSKWQAAKIWKIGDHGFLFMEFR